MKKRILESVSFKLIMLSVTIILMLVSASFIFNSQIDNLKKHIDNIYFGNFVPLQNLEKVNSNYKDMIICIQKREKLCSIKKNKEVVLSRWNMYYKAHKSKKERNVINSINEDVHISLKRKNILKYNIMIQKINFLIEYEIKIAQKQRIKFLDSYRNMKDLLLYNIMALVIFSFAIIIYIIYSIIKKDNELIYLNKKYKIESITDSMTMIYNRNYFDTIFDNIPRVSTNNRWQTAFVMFDIDYFKQYNDTYGHDRGDIALKNVAQELKKYFNKEYEYVFRLGGEEFGAILFDIDKPILIQCLKEVNLRIMNLQMEHRTSSVSSVVTISIGAVIYTPGLEVSSNKLYKIADENLYKSKQNGRNRYTL